MDVFFGTTLSYVGGFGVRFKRVSSRLGYRDDDDDDVFDFVAALGTEGSSSTG